MSKELRDTYDVEIDGCDIEFEYTYELGEKETRDDPGTGTSVDIKHAWMNLSMHKTGGYAKVDVLGVLDVECDYDRLQEQVIKNVNEFYNNPPEDE